MKKKLRIFLVTLFAIVMTAGLTGCGSECKTPELLSEIDFDNGFHIATETAVDGDKTSVDMYQRGEDFNIEVVTSESSFGYIYKDQELTVIDNDAKTAEVTEMSEEIALQIAEFALYGDTLKALASEDAEFTKSAMSIEGMEYEAEETQLSEAVTLKFLYNDEGNLAYMVREAGSEENIAKITAIDGEVTDDNFQVPEGYTGLGVGNGATVQVVNSAGGYSFITSQSNKVNKVDERTMVYTGSGDMPYINIFIMDKGSTENVDGLIDAAIKQAQDKYQNRLPAVPASKTLNFNGYTAKGIEYSYSTVDGTDMICVEQYYIGMGSKWISFIAEYNSTDSVTPAAVYEAMATIKLK